MPDWESGRDGGVVQQLITNDEDEHARNIAVHLLPALGQNVEAGIGGKSIIIPPNNELQHTNGKSDISFFYVKQYTETKLLYPALF